MCGCPMCTMSRNTFTFTPDIKSNTLSPYYRARKALYFNSKPQSGKTKNVRTRNRRKETDRNALCHRSTGQALWHRESNHREPRICPPRTPLLLLQNLPVPRTRLKTSSLSRQLRIPPKLHRNPSNLPRRSGCSEESVWIERQGSANASPCRVQTTIPHRKEGVRQSLP